MPASLFYCYEDFDPLLCVDFICTADPTFGILFPQVWHQPGQTLSRSQFSLVGCHRLRPILFYCWWLKGVFSPAETRIHQFVASVQHYFVCLQAGGNGQPVPAQHNQELWDLFQVGSLLCTLCVCLSLCLCCPCVHVHAYVQVCAENPRSMFRLRDLKQQIGGGGGGGGERERPSSL